MRAVKKNKEYMINDAQKQDYQKMGYDIMDDEGNVVGFAYGKTVPYETYMDVVKEKENLQKQVENYKKENEALNEALNETLLEKKNAAQGKANKKTGGQE